MKKVLSALVGLLVCAASYAQLGLAEIFTDNMVLQRDKPVNVWGTAAPGAKVDVGIICSSWGGPGIHHEG